MSLKNILTALFAFILGFTIIMQISSCTHDDEIIDPIIPSSFEYGDEVVQVSDGYVFDHTHSSVRWETAYLGNSALLTGRFNDFEGTIEFEQDKPDNISFSGSVILSTVNTGEPGRDQGCLTGTFGIVDGDPVSDAAMLVSKSVEQDGSGGYDVYADLTFHGITSEVIAKLKYSGVTMFDESSGIFGAPLNVAGFTAEFQFSAKSVFGIESTNISDAVTVKINMQFKKAL